MANRLQVNDKAIIYQFLCQRDGEYCIICGPGKKHKKLEIDHADGNPFNNAPDNLHFLCPEHNKKMREKSSRQHQKIIKECCAKNVCVCEKKHGNPSTAKVRQAVNYAEGSVEMRANSYFEVNFRDWVLETITEVGPLSKKEIINSGAETVGCSQASTIRYLEKLTSAVGPLHETKDSYGQIKIEYKPHIK